MRAPGKKRVPRAAPAAISARLAAHIALEAGADGTILAHFDSHSVALGKFSAGVAERLDDLRSGLSPALLEPSRETPEQGLELLVRRLAEHGLLEYRLGSGEGKDQAVIEPQAADYWPRTSKLDGADMIVLSRFAYLRRRGNEMVLESPLSRALLRIHDPNIATTLARLSTPQRVSRFRREDGFPGLEFLGLLVDCRLVFKVDAARGSVLRLSEGDEQLALWDFHDLVFHTRSTEGRQANPLGGLYPYAGLITPAPAVRPRWPGTPIDLRSLSTPASQTVSPLGRLLRERRSTRDFDDQQPITLGELSQLLDRTARVHSEWTSKADVGQDGPDVEYAARGYPSGGSAYELELYLAVAKCQGLERGFYHYDAGDHALVPIGVRAQELDTALLAAEYAMGAIAEPQILITIAARFGRVSWKYSSIAYSLILKDVGVLMQTFYMMATDMSLSGCAIGTNNVDLFEKMTALQFHVEGPVGQFAIGRGQAISDEP
ncbi:MAG: SagB family peptide dehydrogenase [Bradyrhizobium sp.]